MINRWVVRPKFEGLARLSDVPTWEPIELFDENAHYRVEATADKASVAGR